MPDTTNLETKICFQMIHKD